MSWESLTGRRGQHYLLVGVSIRQNQRKSVVVNIGGDVVAELGWIKKQKIAVLVGRGEHRGMLRLDAGSVVGGRTLSACGRALRIAFPRIDGNDGKPHAAARAEHRIVDGGGALEITLPDWAWGETVAPIKPHSRAIESAPIKPVDPRRLVAGR